jgi:hypothetical protein
VLEVRVTISEASAMSKFVDILSNLCPRLKSDRRRTKACEFFRIPDMAELCRITALD